MYAGVYIDGYSNVEIRNGTIRNFGAQYQVLPLVGIEKKNVDPFPGSDSTHILPPWRSIIFLQVASPIPVPGYSFFVCRRWNITNI
jgi:hypothetical protein